MEIKESICDKIVLSKELINSVVKQEIDKEVAAAIVEAKARLDKRIPEIVAGFCLSVSKQIEMYSFRDQISIKVIMPEKSS